MIRLFFSHLMLIGVLFLNCKSNIVNNSIVVNKTDGIYALKTINNTYNVPKMENITINDLSNEDFVSLNNIELIEEKFDNEYKSIVLTFNDRGTKEIEQLTRKYKGLSLVIFINNKAVAAPIVREPIKEGKISITGSNEEMGNLYEYLRK